MSKRAKRLQKIRQNPKNVSLDELKLVVEDYGFEHLRTTGSHYIFLAQMGETVWRLTIPFHRPVKQAYVDEALKAIDEIISLEGETGETDNDGNN